MSQPQQKPKGNRFFRSPLTLSAGTMFIQAQFEFRLPAGFSMSSRIPGLPLALVSANVSKILLTGAFTG
jgi:hypothetical protein